jgi:hypothetical protein
VSVSDSSPDFLLPFLLTTSGGSATDLYNNDMMSDI